MAIIPAQETLVAQDSALKLSRYAQVIGGYAECAVFGVDRTADLDDNQCWRPWTKDQRDYVAFYLAEAQEELEEEIGFFLEPKWVVGTKAEQPNGDLKYVDSQKWLDPMWAKWKWLIEGGIRGETDIVLGTAVSHVADPAVIGPVATTVTDVDEIHVFYPDTDVEINPSAITIAGGFVTITIPRCRMVRSDLADTGLHGISYTDTTLYQATVDIKRIFNDPSTNAILVRPHSCTGSCSATGCTEHTQTACIYIRDSEIGTLNARPATRSGGSWTVASQQCCGHELVRLYYRAGMEVMTKQAQDAIRKLAHAKMPYAPCGCDILEKAWNADNKIPPVLTRSRINCPFGLENGAWAAYKFAQRMKTFRVGVLA